MRDIKITEATPSVEEEDILVIRGTVNGRHVEARGYVSDTTNYFPPEDDSHPASDEPTSRQMTPDEKRAYCERLLVAQCTAPVRATKTGYDGVCIREPGDEFELPYSVAYGKSSWFVPVEQAAPAKGQR